MKRIDEDKPVFRHPVRAFAIFSVAVIAAYIVVVGWRLISILSSPDWCARALGAERASPGSTVKGLEACIELMGSQVDALALDSHIAQGVLALCVLTLIVIVVAGAKLDLSVSREGAKANLSRDSDRAAAAAGAHQAAEAAANEATDIETGVAPVDSVGDGR